MREILNSLVGGEDESDKIKFSIDPELKGVVPKPISASKAQPDWYKNLERRSPQDVPMEAGKSAGACMAFLDAMSLGWVLRVPADIHWKIPNKTSENEEPKIITDTDADFNVVNTHRPDQLGTQPGGDFPKNGPIVKFLNQWTIETPPGYSTLFTHPMNRPDPRFHHLSGVVETDNYPTEVNGACIWQTGPGTEGIIKQGTPYAQIIPFKRDDYLVDSEVVEMDEESELEKTREEGRIGSNRGHYKKNVWEPKATKDPIEVDEIDDEEESSCPFGFDKLS